MTLRFAFALAALPCLVGCSDDPQKGQTPTAPSAAVAPATQRISAPSALSAVCRVYKQERDVVQRQLADTPKDAVLEKRVDSYNELIADVCS